MSPPSVMNRIFVSLLSTYNWNTRNILPSLALDENVVMQWELVRIWFDKKPLSKSLPIPSRVDEISYRIFRIFSKNFGKSIRSFIIGYLVTFKPIRNILHDKVLVKKMTMIPRKMWAKLFLRRLNSISKAVYVIPHNIQDSSRQFLWHDITQKKP